MSLWSGEYSLDPDFLGGARARGETVRLIEITVPSRDKNGIFDRLYAVEPSPTELADKAESAVKDNFGHPIRAFVKQLTSNPERHTRRAIELMERFLRNVEVGSDPWICRFATKFAIVYAAARLAAELGVAPWPKRHPLKCIMRLYKRARDLVSTPKGALEGLLSQLAKNASSPKRFPKLKKGDALPAHLTTRAWGVRTKTRDGTQLLAVHSDKLDQLVHPPQYASQVRRLLATGGYTVPGKEGRFVRQIKVRGFGSAEKSYFVCIRRDRLQG